MKNLSNFVKPSDKHMKIKWIHTTDIHGHLKGKMPALRHYINQLDGDVIFTDGGDWLQGSPLAFFSSHIEKERASLLAHYHQMVPYSFAAVGNHDLELGVSFLQDFQRKIKSRFLCANLVDDRGNTIFSPYACLNVQDCKIAVLGLTTDATSCWISQDKLEGCHFLPLLENARSWLEIIQKKEHPDYIVGLFHSGWEGGLQTEEVHENRTCQIAQETEGFHLILYGHDHHAAVHKVRNRVGKEVICAAGSCHLDSFVEVELDSDRGINASIKQVHILSECPGEDNPVFNKWHTAPVYELKDVLDERKSFFGPCSFMNLLHDLQLQISGAEVSLAAPSTYCANMLPGMLTTANVFQLFNFENPLVVLELSAWEIKRILEYTYSLWTNKVSSREDHALLLDYVLDEGKTLGLKHHSRFLLSAYGLQYEVDLTQPFGQKVTLNAPDKMYRVVVNSYYANGGGDIFLRALGMSSREVNQRRMGQTCEPFASSVYQYWIQHPDYQIPKGQNWRFCPPALADELLKRDFKIVFG